MIKYFLYTRKSTDEDDRQVLSLDAQETELMEFALRDKLDVIATFRESQTAKEPGRPVFNQMLARMENGEAQGILAWHPDRLARNSIDGGKIIYLVDRELIQALKFPTFWFEATPQGKFMLSIAFGQSKYFVDNLSENIKRGLRQKLRRGEYPAPAPLGYANDLQNHTIVPHPEKFRLVKQMFEMYATGNYSLKDLQQSMKSSGLLSRSQKPLPVASIMNALSNTFYYGVFKYNGELHEGKHEPMITKKLFEAVQQTMTDRSRPKKPSQKVFPFRNLLNCGECGCAISSEIQKGHTYYRCTKKKGACGQHYIREELLAEQVSDWLKKVSLPAETADWLISELDKEKDEALKQGADFAQNLKDQITELENKLDKLLDTHLQGAITKDEYIAKKQKILNRKIGISENLADFGRNGNHWLEPAKKFILEAKQAGIIALQENLFSKKDFLKKIGSNRLLLSREVAVELKESWKILENFKNKTRTEGSGLLNIPETSYKLPVLGSNLLTVRAKPSRL
ncbi:MAG: recombinase family protein [Candidatus Paceibacterota bacterium]